MTPTLWLRTLGVIAVAFGAVDPGCRQEPRGVVTVATVGDLSPEVRERLLDHVRGAAPWAAVANSSDHDFFSARAGCQAYNPIYALDLGSVCLREP